jgi:KipI family sensor histidine kinase inhibitor
MIRRICRDVGIRPIFEAFPDRAYTADGRLLSRRLPGAVIHEPEIVAERAVRMVAEQRVIAADGTSVPLDAQTLCVHGDTPSAVDLLQKIRAAMAAAEIAVVPMGELVPAQRIFARAHIRLNGDRGLLCEYGNTIDPEVNQTVRAMAQLLMQQPPKGVQSVVPAYRSLCLTYDPAATTPGAVKDHLAQMEGRLTDASLSPPMVVEIPVCYGGKGGPDLAFVAEHAGLSEADVIRLHSAVDYPIYMIGFAPGFCYLGGLDERLSTPRLATPRTMVEAGSVGIANSQTGMYPSASPGGWQLIGRTPLRLFDPGRTNPFLYQPGDRIRFVPISEDEYQQIASREGN